MAVYRQFIVAASLVMIGGCSADDARRLGYATVRNMEQQQCQKSMANDCAQKQSYEAYQRERQEINQ